jgi:SAM-dependent methyltransferase
MQAYSSAFARIYNEKWIGFAQWVAPRIRIFYERSSLSEERSSFDKEGSSSVEERSLLDLCCGTGQLAVHFLEHGYSVVGIDLSEHMLRYARENAAQYIESGQARFLQADAAQFSLDDRFNLVISTFDALNHLPDENALRSCFRSVDSVLKPGGTFVFDLNTRAGLRSDWNGVSIQDTEEITIITRSVYDEQGGKAWTRISGFVRTANGLYERFEQTAYNTVFDLQRVADMLLEIGWRSVHFARSEDLGTPIEDPEAEKRAFIVAQK